MFSKNTTACVGLFALASAGAIPATAEESGMWDLNNASLDIRYRAEFVDQDGIDERALGNTIRTRVGYNLRLPSSFSVYSDVENIRVIGSDDFNSTSNGQGQFPVVADPEDTELNQAYLAWSGIEGTVVKYGRQRINLDNQRFIGAVAWRQNEQTFDGFSVKSKIGENVNVFAAHLTNTNRIFGDSHPNPALADLNITAEVVNVAWDVGNVTVIPYAYLVEFDANAAASNATTGVRVKGKTALNNGGGDANKIGVNYIVEYAQQGDYRDGVSTIDHEYIHGEVSLAVSKVNFKAGHEKLGSNGGVSAFSMPLSTLHKFNGWADLFLATPANGLRDSYVSVGSKLAGFKVAAIYHDFSADVGDADYGTEIDFIATRKFGKNYSFLFKYANYSAQDFGTDRSRAWLQLGAKF
ncbi:MAG: alginate export family protein [Pseudomonadota bacterium]